LELSKKTIRSLIFGAVGCIVLYWLLHETGRVTAFLKNGWAVLSPFIAGAAVAFVLNVPMRAIEKGFSFIKKPGLRRAVAILLTLLADIADIDLFNSRMRLEKRYEIGRKASAADHNYSQFILHFIYLLRFYSR